MNRDNLGRFALQPTDIKRRLMDNHLVDPSTECWNWTLSVDSKGYGQMGVDRRMRAVHRLAYECFIGPTNGLHVLHRCDNPRCLNPRHLFLGTQLDNMQDCAAKGRARSGNRKLSHPEAYRARVLYWNFGLSQQEIAAHYNMNQSTISSLITGETWRRFLRN